tara:strand:- start:64 stop:831 length:768 start_codon:yes stop_codon:yes gene_type:complete
MEDIHIVTYATHNEGSYNELMKSNIVKNLGWGKKWNGFKDKFIAIEKYTKNLVDIGKGHDIVIFVDGFDTKIRKNFDINQIVENFYNIVGEEGGILVSNDPMLASFTRRIFGTCKNNCIANTGLYMGNAWKLNQLLKESLEYKCKDDQIVFNNLCEKHEVHIDYNNTIFKNLNYGEKEDFRESFFIQTPGKISYNRYYRALFEYSQFFILYIILSYSFIIYLIVKNNHKKRTNHIILLAVLLFILFYYNIDKSCI